MEKDSLNVQSGLSRKEIARKLLEESGARYVQKTGAFLMPLSKEQRESMQKISEKEKEKNK